METKSKSFSGARTRIKGRLFSFAFPLFLLPRSTLLLSSSLLPTSYLPFPLASITIDYPHFLLRAFCNSGCRRIRRLCCVALSISSGKSNYTEDKTDGTATAGIRYGREYGRACVLGKKSRITIVESTRLYR